MSFAVCAYAVLGALWLVSARACAYGGWLTRRSLLVILAAGVLAVLCGFFGPCPELRAAIRDMPCPGGTLSTETPILSWNAPFLVLFALFHLIIQVIPRVTPPRRPFLSGRFLALTGFGLPLPFLLISIFVHLPLGFLAAFWGYQF